MEFSYRRRLMPSFPPNLNRIHIPPGDRVCAAISGGADSVALLLLLHAGNRLPRKALGVGLSAAHVHHGMRGEEADADLAFVEQLCARLEVPLHVRRVDTAARAATERETLEEAARALRYGFFAELMAEGHADAVLTAHTLDDQAETVLMKLLRGAWTEGLGGIHPVVYREEPKRDGAAQAPAMGRLRAGRILRPLLAVRRGELEAYLNGQGQTWRTDSSNADPAFTRNRVRHQLLPLLRAENPQIDHALANLAELAREDEAYWQEAVGRLLPQLLLPGKPVRGGGRAVSTAAGGGAAVAIELERLRGLDPPLRRRVLRAAARQLGARLSFDETSRLLALAGLAPASGLGPEAGGAARPSPPLALRLDLASGLRAERTARELRLVCGSPVAAPAQD